MSCSTGNLLATFANGGLRVRVTGDSTANFGEWYVSGSDTYPGGWQCFVVDTSKAFTNTGGTPPSLSTIRYVGGTFSVTSMVTGNFSNCAIDAIRYGSGLRVTGGTDEAPLDFDHIISEDNNVSNAYGIINRVGGIVFLQGELEFGSSSSGNTVFQDNNEIIAFRNPLTRTSGGSTVSAISESLYKITVSASSSATNRFILGTKVGSGDDAIGINGCTFSSSNIRFAVNFDNEDITDLNLYGCQFINSGLINIGNSTTGLAGNTELLDNFFSNNNQLTRNITGTHNFLNNTVSSNISTEAAIKIADDLVTDSRRLKILLSNGFTSRNDSVTESFYILNADFSSLTEELFAYIRVYAKKTWNAINPIWTVITTDLSKLNFSVNDANQVNEIFTYSVLIVDGDLDPIENAVSYIFEGNFNSLPPENIDLTDETGFEEKYIKTREFTWDGSSAGLDVVSYGNFASKIYYYGLTPFVRAIPVASPESVSISLLADSAITEPVAANAISSGSGIQVERHGTEETDPRPIKVLNFDNGNGTVPSAENTITGTSSGATGSVIEVLGDGTEGTLVLESWNGTEFEDNEELSNGSGWTSDADTTGFYQEYTRLVKCNNLSLSAVYNYLAARMAEHPITSTFEQILIWGRGEQSQLMYLGVNGYFTNRVVFLQEGVWMSNRGSGTVAFMTSDNGTQYIPPVTFSFELTGLKSNSEVRIFRDTGEELAGTEGSGTSFSYNYIYTGNISIYVVIFHLSWRDIRLTGLTLSNANQSIPIQQQIDRVYFNP